MSGLDTAQSLGGPKSARGLLAGLEINWRDIAQTLCLTLGAILASMLVFGVFMTLFTLVQKLVGHRDDVVSPFELYDYMYLGAIGTSFSWQNTLSKAAPLVLTALCTALPARVGLVIIGGEGALVLGGLAAACTSLLLNGAPTLVLHVGMIAAGLLAGGLLIAGVGALRHYRGVNETICSLLVAYITFGVLNFLVEGPLRHPNPISQNKPGTVPIARDLMMGKIFGYDCGLVFGVVLCVAAWVLMYRTTFGFGARMVGGNVRAAQGAGLPVGRILLITCFLGGAAAGLAGVVEVGAIHGQANASLIAGYGFTGILVSFIARHHPLGIIPVAILFGGLNASSGVLQRYLKVPDASVQVLMGIMFILILLVETLYGRFRVFMPREVREATAR